MRRVQSVGTVSLPAEGIAASAAYDCAAHPAVHPPWGRTTATIVAKPSNHRTRTIVSRVCTHRSEERRVGKECRCRRATAHRREKRMIDRVGGARPVQHGRTWYGITEALS